MSPRDHFKQSFTSPYFQSEEYKKTEEYKIEQKIERLFGRIKRGIRRIIWPF